MPNIVGDVSNKPYGLCVHHNVCMRLSNVNSPYGQGRWIVIIRRKKTKINKSIVT